MTGMEQAPEFRWVPLFLQHDWQEFGLLLSSTAACDFVYARVPPGQKRTGLKPHKCDGYRCTASVLSTGCKPGVKEQKQAIMETFLIVLRKTGVTTVLNFRIIKDTRPSSALLKSITSITTLLCTWHIVKHCQISTHNQKKTNSSTTR